MGTLRILTLFGLVVTWLCLLVVADPRELEAKDLEVQISSELAGAPRLRKVVYASIVDIEGMVDWEDGKIVQLAFTAHDAVKTAHEEAQDNSKWSKLFRSGELSENRPTMTGVLVVGNTAYIATSLRGGAYIYNPSKPPNQTLNERKARAIVYDALMACQVEGPRPGHRTGASCAEIMALVIAVQAGWDTIEQFEGRNARVVAVMTDESGNTVIRPPCSEPSDTGSWGCRNVIARTNEGKQRIKAILPGVQPISCGKVDPWPSQARFP